jgi:hypothetical protein
LSESPRLPSSSVRSLNATPAEARALQSTEIGGADPAHYWSVI